MEIIVEDLKIGEEVECYAFALYLDNSGGKFNRKIAPAKGVIKRINVRSFKFHPYTKKGLVGSKNIDYYGSGYSALSLFTIRSETVEAWREKVEETKRVFNKTRELLNSYEAELEEKVLI